MKFQIFGKFLLILIAFFALRFMFKKFVLRVVFKENEVHVHQLHRNVKLKYTEIGKIQEHREYFLYNLILLYPKNNQKVRYYFNCPANQRKELEEFLKDRRLRILPQT
jgi:hypothetical protein